MSRPSEQIVYLECLTDYQENCGTNFPESDFLPAVLKTLNKFCNKGTVLFNAVADNGKCVGKFYKTITEDRLNKCLQKIEDENREKYEEIVYFSNDLKDEEREYCFLDIMQTSCLADAISVDCGKTAKELFLHILQDIGMNNLVCENHQDDAKNFTKELSLNLKPENSMEDFIALLENETEFV
nr:uncharacterized protein LOC107454638 isoform X2 [Parasteatoda tepidariorum]